MRPRSCSSAPKIVEDSRRIVFVTTDPANRLAAEVAAHSFRARSSSPGAFDVRFIAVDDHPWLAEWEGRRFRYFGQAFRWRTIDHHQFHPLRFLAPELAGYRGRVLVVDPDVFALADVGELLGRDMEEYAVLARPSPSSRPGTFATSVMLLDCDRLHDWRLREWMRDVFARRIDYFDLHHLRLEPPGRVGPLDREWNEDVRWQPETRLLHMTDQSTQPWRLGLPVRFELARLRRTPPRALAQVGRVLRRAGLPLEGPRNANLGHARSHPDERYGALFLDLLADALEQGAIPHALVDRSIECGYVRADLWRVLTERRAGGTPR